MPNTSLTKAKILEEVQTMLGGTSVDVELIENDVAKCVKDALRVYNHNLPMRARKAIAVTPGQKRYILTHPQLEGVTEVEFVSQSVYSGIIDPFTVVGQSLAASLQAAPGVSYGDVYQQQMMREDASKLASTNPDWYGQWEHHVDPAVYALYIDVAANGLYHVAYTYAWHLTPDNEPLTGMQLAPNEDVDWIQEYILARAKQILSRKLGKFGGITNPDGAPDPTDAAELRQEGREDQIRLDESILKRRRPLLPVID